jgi:HK97 family phage major capsid protein
VTEPAIAPDFVAQLRARLDERIAARAAAVAELNTITSACAAENRTDMNPAETAQFAEIRARLDVLDLTDPTATGYDNSIASVQARHSDLVAIENRTHEIATRTPAPTVDPSIRVGAEARTYRPDLPVSFFADLYASQTRSGNYWEADDRQRRHSAEVQHERRAKIAAMPEEYRAITVSSVAGAVPPQYLVDEYAAFARAGRPFLNSLNSRPLPPDGVTFVIPRGTTGTTAAQTAEGAAFTDSNVAATDLSLTVNLTSVAQDISRTLFMRGSAVIDSIIFPDLIEALAVASNVSAINGSGTAPQHRGVLQVAGLSAVAYTDATPTVGEMWPKLADGIQRVNSLRFMPTQAIYMHPRRWGWITAAVDSTGRPLFEFSTMAPQTVFGLGKANEYGQVVGQLMGIPVITDASIPVTLGAGTEDIVFTARTNDFVFWEDDVMQFTFEQAPSTAPGQVRLAAGQFQLFSAARYPTGISTIGGTGLIAPTF